MVDWKEHYRQHLVSMDAVVSDVKDGDALWFGAAPEIPYSMLEKLHDRMDELHDVTLLYNVMNYPTSLVFDEEAGKHFNFVSMFCLPLERMAAEYGNAPFHSCPFEFIPRTAVDVYKCNTVAINVCPPDEEGYVNIGIYGVSASGLIASDPRVAKKIAIIDHNQPAAGGSREQVCLKITDFDNIVECDSEPQEVPGHGPTELDEKIASHVIPYIHDGDKLQVGYGGLGDAILAGLHGRIKHLDIYSEVCSESMQPLVESGVVDTLRFCSSGVGSPSFYRFLAENPKVDMRNIKEMIEPISIGNQDNIVAVNSTFMVDLSGQACSEAQGIDQYSAVGGQFAYMYGAIRSKGGRSFLCLRSTHKDHDGETHSNIVPWLPEKSVVTTPRYLMMYIVTEYGVADIFLKTLKERAVALVQIAHPDYRKQLKEDIIANTDYVMEADFEDIEL